MNRTSILFVAAAVGLAACDVRERDEPAGRASAPADQAVASRFADGNRDGRVTREEASVDPYLSASFDRYDRNANNELDRAEFARLEARATEPRAATEDEERHQLRPRREFPRPLD